MFSDAYQTNQVCEVSPRRLLSAFVDHEVYFSRRETHGRDAVQDAADGRHGSMFPNNSLKVEICAKGTMSVDGRFERNNRSIHRNSIRDLFGDAEDPPQARQARCMLTSSIAIATAGYSGKRLGSKT